MAKHQTLLKPSENERSLKIRPDIHARHAYLAFYLSKHLSAPAF